MRQEKRREEGRKIGRRLIEDKKGRRGEKDERKRGRIEEESIIQA